MSNTLIRNEQFTHAMGQKNNGGQQLKKVSKNTNKRVYIQFIGSFSEITISQNLKITFSKYDYHYLDIRLAAV